MAKIEKLRSKKCDKDAFNDIQIGRNYLLYNIFTISFVFTAKRSSYSLKVMI